ncbi:30S ribosomal protein S13 [Candidatus Gugararchaeum adminiculabundum]|nr:30S ribosomal protein S13 [Candidatus Gugararchaeum adminiculabundum]
MAVGKTKKKFKNKEPPRAHGAKQEERKIDENKKLASGVMFKDIRGIVRLSGKDVPGETDLKHALAKVKGIGERLAQILHPVIISELHLHEKAVIGELNDEQLDHMEKILSNPLQYKIPAFLVNRQGDAQAAGETRHLIGNDLSFATRQDIEREKNLFTWKGYRHAYGQKVRGQHTRTSGRQGMTVGVMRSALKAAAGAGVPDAAAAQKAAIDAATGAAPKAGPAPKGAAKGAAPAAGKAPAAGAAPAAKPAAKPAEKK